uniref:NAD-dependent protein deacetylase n=1 Tax=Oncorhynchus kisutch TaxID=8019 RepID=A0A8C7MTZ9_ONCKI
MSDVPEASNREEVEENTPEPEEQSDDSSDDGEASGDTEMDFLRNLFSKTLGISGEKVLDELTLEGVASYIQSGKCKNIICMVGAGISTSAGIPDFRSPDTGLYANLQKYNLPYPEAIFQIDYFKKHPEPFFALARELYPGQFKPTVCHYFIKLLKDKGLLKRCYSQNIDTLERVAGLEGEDLIEAHGTFYTSHCAQYWFLLPSSPVSILLQDFPRCDLLIIMGTSLQVQPFAALVGRVSNSCPRLLINLEKAGGVRIISIGGGMDFDSAKAYRDVAHISTCDDGCLALAELLGWKAELEEMVKREHEKINSKAEEEQTNQSSGAAGKAESGKAESGKAESGMAESGMAESGKAESGKAEVE